MTKKDKDARASKVLKLGVAVVSPIAVFYFLAVAVMFLEGDIGWFSSKFGYHLGWVVFLVALPVFVTSSLVLANRWLTKGGKRSRWGRIAAGTCGAGLAVFLGSVLFMLAGEMLLEGALVGRWNWRVWNWVPLFGLFWGLSISIVGIITHFASTYK